MSPFPFPPTATTWLWLGKETLTLERLLWKQWAQHIQATGTRLRSPVGKDQTRHWGLCWILEEGTRRLGTEKQVTQLQGDPQLELDTHLERQ